MKALEVVIREREVRGQALDGGDDDSIADVTDR